MSFDPITLIASKRYTDEEIKAAIGDIDLSDYAKTEDIKTEVEAALTEAKESGEFKGEQGVSGVYVGDGEMPDGYNVQIDPTGEAVIIPTKTSELENDSEFITQELIGELSFLKTKDKSNIVNAINEISTSQSYVTPQMYGAVGNGTTDDTAAIKQCLAENDYIYFPRGRYRMTEPLEINRDNITIVGEGGTEGGETYGKTRIEFESCDGVVFNSGRNITFSGVSVWAKDEGNEYCAFKFNAPNTMHKTHISNCMIWYFKYGISESLGDTPCTIWNCTFEHIKTFNVEYAIYLAQTGQAANHFGVLFEDFYSDNGKVYLSYGKYTFLNCNFGIRTKNYMRLQNSCYTTWINCNFECDEAIPFDDTVKPRENHCIEFNGKGHLFVGCQFAVKGEQKDEKTVFLIDVKSDLRMLKFVNCYSWTDGVATIWYTSGDYGEAGCITFVGDNMDKPNWTGGYLAAYNSNVDNGLTNAHENYKASFPDNFMYWQYGNKEIRYYKDGIVYDSHGNDIATRKNPPIKIGAGFYLDFGEIEVAGSVIDVTYNRQVDGQVSITTPPIIDGVPVMVFRDVSDDHKDKTNYARFQIKMWDDTDKTWVDNTKTFTLKWMKISL